MRVVVVGVGWLLTATSGPAGERTLSYNRDVRPILSDRCFSCHGPDANHRESGLRLDLRDSAVQPAASGVAAIVPGDAAASELVRRIFAGSDDEVMPPPEMDKPLTASEQQRLRRWVEEGAVYEPHWAFIPPQRSPPPDVSDLSWGRNPIDRFILARLEQEGRAPSPAADRATLLRRVTLDLTGLPPAPDDVIAFEAEIAAAGSTAVKDRIYEQRVERLLNSPHYGERMAVDWLDAARFADSNGYQVDRDREVYAWRDWVIEAFNSNQPFDAFTVDQLAGDLLPDPTLPQKIATGFHRNHMMNEEGGIIPEEFLAEYCFDRVEMTATVWLGQTFNCCRCHDHKFDPFTQTDYYGLYAFFHNIAEKGVGDYGSNIRRNAPPILQLPTPELENELDSLKRQLETANRELAEVESRLAAEQTNWEGRLLASDPAWTPVPLASASVGDSAMPIDADRLTTTVPPLEAGTHLVEVVVDLPQTGVNAVRIEWIAATRDRSPDPAFKLTSLRLDRHVDESAAPVPIGVHAAEVPSSLPAAELSKALDDNDKTTAVISWNPDAPVVPVAAIRLSPDASWRVRLEFSIEVERPTTRWQTKLLATSAAADLLVPAEIHRIASLDVAARREQEIARIAEFYRASHAEYGRLESRVDNLTKAVDTADLQIPTTLVMEEMPTPRETFVLLRGAYNRRGAAVTAAPPAVLPELPAGLPRNRLGLARWLVDAENPLPARVTVNRFWQSLFGVGLVRTAEDFGAQGEPPSHPRLLDWLAVEFVESGWDVKSMMRRLVTSSTYRQSSRTTPELLARDPHNRLLARGPRIRLQAEFVRDQALAASGLMVSRLGGPSVRPYHPPNLYEQVVAGSGASTYVLGSGAELYRRSLYSYWKRSVPNPAMLVFDAPFREMCVMRRSRTNTPLQALNLMNDPTYVEAARFLAERMIREGGERVASRIARGFVILLGRRPRPAEVQILSAAYTRAHADFAEDLGGANALLAVGVSPRDARFDTAELAAMATVASTLLNLDETVTKE